MLLVMTASTRSILLLISASLFFTVSFSLVKFLSGALPTHTIMLCRFLAGPVYLIPYFMALRKKVLIRSYRLFFIRIIFGVSGMTCLFLSFKYGDIAKSMLLFECAMLWTLLFDYFVFKIKPHPYSLMAIPVALIGMYLVLEPHNLSYFHLGCALNNISTNVST